MTTDIFWRGFKKALDASLAIEGISTIFSLGNDDIME